MTPREELLEILDHMKNILVTGRDMGMDPPILSSSSLAYLDRKGPDPGSLEQLREFIGDCKRCKLCRGRTNLVFGEGNPQAPLLFIGEGPGRDEDLEGRPFVGEAGRLLTKIIQAMGLKRENVYICNVVKCRPPHNRDPEEDEIQTCIPFLRKQIELVGPRAICTLGRVAAQGILERNVKITQERGKWLSYGEIPLMPTFHPAYLIRNPSAKRPLWEDVQKIMKHLGLEVNKNA